MQVIISGAEDSDSDMVTPDKNRKKKLITMISCYKFILFLATGKNRLFNFEYMNIPYQFSSLRTGMEELVRIRKNRIFNSN